MSRVQPADLEDIARLAEAMAENPAHAVHQARLLSEMLGALPPEQSELLTRPRYHRSANTNLSAVFERLDPDDGARTVSVRLPEDYWIRGLVGVVLPQWPKLKGFVDPEDVLEILATLNECTSRRSPNWLDFVEVGYQLNNTRGFLSSQEAGDVLAPGPTILGDGEWVVPLDWKLQRNDVLSVTARNITRDRNDPDQLATMERQLVMVVVSFWCEPMG